MDKPATKSGIRAALEYTGYSSKLAVLLARDLPSRNWLIFITLTSSVLSYYTYDRHQARKIRASYIDRVKHFSEEPMKSSELPRKVTVYGAKWPGDEDHQRAIRFFKKYVKLHVASSVVKQRRIDLGIDQPPLNEAQKRGVILVGRHTLKEYLEGLKVDREERLAQELAADGTFDEVDEGKSPVGVVGDAEVEPIPTSSRLPPSRNAALLPPLGLSKPSPVSDVTSKTLVEGIKPPSTLPAQPPLLLVPFTNHIGFRYIPHMIWSFFNERDRVRAGAEAAYALVLGQTRDFRGPNSWRSDDAPLQEEHNSTENRAVSGAQDSVQGGDLDFMLWSEKLFAPHSPLSSISDARKSYYSSLPREMTKEEEKNPPASEVELRAERLTKESKWRAQEEGWNIVRPGTGVRWDERFRGVLKVFSVPKKEEGESTGTGAA
ncbi:mitochondrial import inner membrane translocase subunit Tim54 [Pisolithus microcarpus]|nr:mitochondrial import inner membrane translocase subunit Tim54 [Pisolithus microcarpus]